MRFSGCLSFILCICLIVCSLSIFAHAIDIEIDLSDLFAPSAGDNTDGGNTDDGGNTGDTDDGGNKDTGKKPGKVDTVDKTTGSSDKDDEKEEAKEEEKKEEVVYKSDFKDVTEDKWYYSYVKNLASKGIVNGYEDDTFRPQNNVTRAEFIKLLVECMGYQKNAMPAFDDVKDSDWFYTYVSTAVKNGVIVKEEYGANLKPNEVISREEAAKLLVRAAKLETGKYQTPYKDSDNEYVVALYTICLMQGEIDTATGDRYFKPQSGITRAETSTVFSRLLEYNAEPEKFVEEKMKEYGLEELKVLMTGTNSFNNAIYGIGVSPMSFYLYRLDRHTSHDDFSNSMLLAYQSAFSHLPEIFTFTDIDITKTQSQNGTDVAVKLVSTSEDFSMQDLTDMYALSKVRAKEISSMLFEGRQDSFSDIEKAKIIYTYLTQNVSYPSHGTETDIDYTSMGVFANNRGMCQGIASAFNLLCKASGLNCCAVSFDNHSFNCIIIDGEYLFFDCTYEITSKEFSDSEGEKLNCFAMSHEKAENIHGKFSLPLAFWCTLE